MQRKLYHRSCANTASTSNVQLDHYYGAGRTEVSALFLGHSKIVFLALVNILLLFVGTDGQLSCDLILAPILAPIAVDGIHPLHFGLIFVYNMVIGLITPRGQVLFVACPISNLNLEEVTRGTLPFLITEIVVLFLLTYVPELTLWLPRMFGFA